MSYNNQIGHGWYPDDKPEDDLTELAGWLLKDKLTEVFNLHKERRNERLKERQEANKKRE